MSPKNEWPSRLVARLRTASWLYNAILGSLEAGWRNQRGAACGISLAVRSMQFRARMSVLVAALFAGLSGVALIHGRELLAAQQDADSKASAPAAAAGVQIPETLPKGKKLVLKDGTFQLAREYAVEDGRVRYWSVERSQWEEIPASLIDWDATHKGEAEQAARDAELKAKIHASNMARLTKDIDVDRSLEIKPALFLPDEAGFYAIDRDKQIRAMKQSAAEVKLAKGREIEKLLVGVPLIPDKKTIEIPGARAALRLTTAEPEFYMRPADRREPRIQLLHAQLKNGHRLIDTVSSNMVGEESHKNTEVEILTWNPVTGVFRYTVAQRLEPGEYAFVLMTAEGISGFVWDFGIDPPGSKTR
jgi:hypothetical protein